MAISPNVLAGLAAGLQGGLRSYNAQRQEDEAARIQREQEDRQNRILQRSLVRDEIADFREQQRDERELAGTVAQTYANRPDALVNAADVARLQKHGYSGMLGERAAPADMREFAALSDLLAPNVRPQSATARESFVQPTEQQVAQRGLLQRQTAQFDDVERERQAESTYRNWVMQNPTASQQARWQKANELGVKFGGASPAEEAAEQRERDAFQVRLTGMRNQPATTTGRSTEDERLFQSNPWEFFYREGTALASRAIPSLAAAGNDINSIMAQADAQAKAYATQRWNALVQGQQEDAAHKASAGQRGGQAPPANAAQSSNAPKAGWDDALADQLVGLKPGQKADQKKVVELVRQMEDQDETVILQAVKWAHKHGIVVNFGGGQ